MFAQVTATSGIDARPPRPFEIVLQSADGTAASPGDYGAVDSNARFEVADFNRVDIGSGDWRWVAIVSHAISIVEDSVVEDSETFQVTLGRSAELSPAIALGTPGETTITIEDNDEADWTLAVGEETITEAGRGIHDGDGERRRGDVPGRRDDRARLHGQHGERHR